VALRTSVGLPLPGQLLTIGDAFSEQEAYGVEALAFCVRLLLPKDLPFYEVRAFGSDESDPDHGMYKTKGGNFCSFLQGLLQLYLPGVAATIYNVVDAAYEEANWEEMGFPSPYELGLRTTEYLSYKQSGSLGLHEDGGSVFSVSVALSEEEDYSGGYFQLKTGDALFRVPRRSAVVFFSEAEHGITEITHGERRVFVAELWEEDDAPVGLPRPRLEQFEEYKEKRKGFLPDEDADASFENGGDEL
jgi:hypothetical protein